MRRATTLLTLSLFACLVGCGDRGPVLFEVTGRVTLDGQPLEQGRITFRALDNSTASASGPIEKGQYALKSLPGKKRVEITASRQVTGAASGSGEPALAVESLVPPKYNRQSELTAEISVDSDNRFDYPLSTGPK